CQQGYNLPLTF
nr:immunoglobulin light chain junction region [Macaca mulatta]MOW52403.1 immunoglobulin light chain junction region [Macaca mulatta]MOW53757.1 immunoglobulin light chain junction region [Macaca mulatta]MOW55405.1 immunoglobulin light chain junction region [Macaca mulatta]MOW56137.1 immunoglobulin light chain junction region [Macaca mulatta]